MTHVEHNYPKRHIHTIVRPLTLMLGTLLLTFCFPYIQTSSAQVSGISKNALVRQGINLYGEQKFETAITVFKRAYKWSGSTRADRIEALKYLAFCYIVLRRDRQGRDAFTKLLGMSPSFRLDASNPPKFRNFFQKVLSNFQANRKISVVANNPQEWPSSKPLLIRFKITDRMKRVRKVIIWHRLEGDSQYRKSTMTEVPQNKWSKGSTETVVLKSKTPVAKLAKPLKPVKKSPVVSQSALQLKSTRYFLYNVPVAVGLDARSAYFVEFYVEVFNMTGKKLALQGTTDRPLRIKRTIPKKKVKPPPPFYTQWWFLTGVGVVVAAGAATAIGIAVANSKPDAPPTGGTIITIVR